MKRLVLTMLLVLGIMATSFNKGEEVEVHPPVDKITNSLDNLRTSLDSLNTLLDGTN